MVRGRRRVDSQDSLRGVARNRRRTWHDWGDLGARAEAAYQGLDSIPQLVAFAVIRGTPRLFADDVALLNTTDLGDTYALRWRSGEVIEKLERLIDQWADRGVRERYRLQRPEREALLDCLGASLWEDGRALVLVAAQLGRSFIGFSDDFERPDIARMADRAGIVPSPGSFLSEAANAPPSLGQMTPIAAVRRWCGAFWYAGSPRALQVFGTIPSPRRVTLPNLVRATLERAVQEQTLRVASVMWRRHDLSELALHAARRGCFAVARLKRPAQPDCVDRLLSSLAEQKAHIAVLPELMLDEEEFRSLAGALVSRARRYPALLVVGRTHRQAASGGRFVNSAAVLGSDGTVIFEHEKLEPFTAPGFGPEDIVPRESGEYCFLDTPVGRLVVNICRDVRSDVPMVLNRALGASLLLVPAYSNKLDFAAEEARVLGARQGAVVLAVNPLSSGLRDAVHLYVPIEGTKASEGTISREEAEGAVPAGRDALVQVWEIGLGERRVAVLAARHRVAV